jgi:hypothetical protein
MDSVIANAIPMTVCCAMPTQANVNVHANARSAITLSKEALDERRM